MKWGRGSHKVVGEVGPPEVTEVDRPELLPKPLRACERGPAPEVLEELRPKLGEVVPALNVLLE